MNKLTQFSEGELWGISVRDVRSLWQDLGLCYMILRSKEGLTLDWMISENKGNSMI